MGIKTRDKMLRDVLSKKIFIFILVNTWPGGHGNDHSSHLGRHVWGRQVRLAAMYGAVR